MLEGISSLSDVQENFSQGFNLLPSEKSTSSSVISPFEPHQSLADSSSYMLLALDIAIELEPAHHSITGSNR